MTLEGLQAVLTLLFGQVGVLGTVLIGFSAILFYLLREERAEHAKTRLRAEELHDRRLELAKQTLIALHEQQTALNALVDEVRRKSGGRR